MRRPLRKSGLHFFTIFNVALILAANLVFADELKVSDVIDSFLYEDIVVEGVVEGIEKEMVLHEDVIKDAKAPFKIPFVNIKFRISKVLIGYYEGSYIPVTTWLLRSTDYLFDLEIGDTYILALHLSTLKGEYTKGKYVLGNDADRFLVKQNTWLRGRKSDPISTGDLDDLYKVTKAINNMRSLEALTREANWIVRGTIIDMSKTDEHIKEGVYAWVIKIKLNVSSKLKGALDDNTITIKTIKSGIYNPSWAAPFPEMNLEEEWYAFLKWAEEPGYYAFAGVNGLFRVVDNTLMRGGYNKTQYSPKKFEEAISRELISDGGPGQQ